MADDSSTIDTLGVTAQGKLKSLVERIERLEEERKALELLREQELEAKRQRSATLEGELGGLREYFDEIDSTPLLCDD